jgi:hypothetical protein
VTDKGLFDGSIAWSRPYDYDDWYATLFMDDSRVDQVEAPECDPRKKYWSSREAP